MTSREGRSFRNPRYPGGRSPKVVGTRGDKAGKGTGRQKIPRDSELVPSRHGESVRRGRVHDGRPPPCERRRPGLRAEARVSLSLDRPAVFSAERKSGSVRVRLQGASQVGRKGSGRPVGPRARQEGARANGARDLGLRGASATKRAASRGEPNAPPTALPLPTPLSSSESVLYESRLEAPRL